MGVFWKYFHETLAWPWIFRPGPLAVLVRGLALYMDDVRQDILWLRAQFVAATAHDALMPGYGASRGVPRTRYDSDARFRTRVERAFVWHKLSAKVEGLPQILAEYGYPGVRVRNMRADNPALWAHFAVRLPIPLSGEWHNSISDAVHLINVYKPGRSIMGDVRTSWNPASRVRVSGVVLAHTRAALRVTE